jgi:CPA2 family monovalent cation:H+ antiporter-2
MLLLFSLIAKPERYEITISFFPLGTAFGLAFLSSHQLSFSAATGAFLAGVVIAGSKCSEMTST